MHQQVGFDLIQTGLCSTVIMCLQSEGEVFGLYISVVAFLHLILKHMGQFLADCPMIFLLRMDNHGLFQHFTISHHAEEGKLTGDGRRKVVEQSAPLIEDGVLLLTGS